MVSVTVRDLSDGAHCELWALPIMAAAEELEFVEIPGSPDGCQSRLMVV